MSNLKRNLAISSLAVLVSIGAAIGLTGCGKEEVKETPKPVVAVKPRPNLELIARFTNAKRQGNHLVWNYVLTAGATERRYGLTGTAMEIYAINSGLEYSTIDFTDPSVIREITAIATEIEYANPQLEQRRLRERGDSYHVNYDEAYNVPATLVHPPQ